MRGSDGNRRRRSLCGDLRSQAWAKAAVQAAGAHPWLYLAAHKSVVLVVHYTATMGRQTTPAPTTTRSQDTE